MSDRYLKIVLTVIALELGWIAVKDMAAVPVSAQNQNAPMPVMIRGIDLLQDKDGPLPISLDRESTPVRVISARPLQVENLRPLTIQANQPILVETAQKPLLIQSVPAGTAPRPGPGQ
jgi:hypothetical protein